MKPRTGALRRASLGLLGAALAAPLPSQAGSALAVEMGCYNCHGQPLRAAAPSFERLATRFEKRRGDAAAEQHVVDEIRSAGTAHGIQLHQRVSTESARQLVHWLFEGAK